MTSVASPAENSMARGVFPARLLVLVLALGLSIGHATALAAPAGEEPAAPVSSQESAAPPQDPSPAPEPAPEERKEPPEPRKEKKDARKKKFFRSTRGTIVLIVVGAIAAGAVAQASLSEKH